MQARAILQGCAKTCECFSAVLLTVFHTQTVQPIAVTRVEVTEKKMSQSNSLGLLGRKVGMMRLFTDDGDAVPVTVVDVSNNRVTQIKTQENDGYVALQVTFGARKASRVTKPEAGHLAKAGVEAGEIIQEFRVTSDAAAQYKAGSAVPVAAVFAVGQRSTCKAPPSVRATPAPSNATT
jgi:large subunit ribosomal protein L3